MSAIGEDRCDELIREIENNRDYILVLCRRYLNKDDADDAAQEVIYKALAALTTYRGDATLKTWLFKIIRFHCLNVLRGNGRTHGMDDEYITQIPDPARGTRAIDDELYRTQLLEQIQDRAVSRKPPWDGTDCAIFGYRFSDPSLSFEEIAKRLGKNENMIKYRYYERVLPTLEEVGRMTEEGIVAAVRHKKERGVI
jgi:RNA polymerase sigma-70 factor, ECF subfamily